VKVIATALLLHAVALIIGFLGFAYSVDTLPPSQSPHADGVIVFTGEPRRMELGARILAGSRARRMLITGMELAGGSDTADVLAQLLQSYRALFECCVDLDAAAKNTVENARDAARWARRYDFRSVILVTSDFHTPRALLELESALPGTVVVPHPLLTGSGSLSALWREPIMLRRIGAEYLKFTAAWIRVRVMPHLSLSLQEPATHRRCVSQNVPVMRPQRRSKLAA
jgi:uncharacterized SAM-binding protein YcdF (DUF218 family)